MPTTPETTIRTRPTTQEFFHGVKNIDALCENALKRYENKYIGRPLPQTYRDDCISYLKVVTVKLALNYDPARNNNFEKYAASILPPTMRRLGTNNPRTPTLAIRQPHHRS